MNRYIAILRGVNVSGAKPMKMEELRKTIQKLGFTGVSTYIQSGNVVFTAGETATSQLAAQLAEAIKTGFGFEVPVMVLSAAELKTIISNNPLNNATNDTAFLHITFLADPPAAFSLSEIEARKQGEEAIVVAENAVYLYCPNGYGNTKLSNTFLESKLKVAATTRNWKTACELLRMAEEN